MSKAAEWLTDRLALLHMGMMLPWDRRNCGVGQVVEQKMSAEQRQLMATLKSDDLAKMAPWAVFGDRPDRRRQSK